MRRTALVLSTMAVMGLAPLAATPAEAATPHAAVTVAPKVTYNSEILRLTNLARAHHHLAPLKPAICANRYAAVWARKLSAVKALSHQSLMPIMTSCKANAAGENVAYGDVTPAQLVTLWMNSPGHRANILNPSYTHLGVAAVRNLTDLNVYAVQDFVKVG